jgi:hypothetical protein
LAATAGHNIDLLQTVGGTLSTGVAVLIPVAYSGANPFA